MNEPKMGISGRIAAAFQSAQITPLLALVAFLLGVFAVMVTPREEEPQINVTMANVIAPFPGASVREVEQMVAIPAEQVLSKIAGVEHVYSVSRPGVAIMTVQFKVGVPRTEALVKLHDTIRENADWLPRNLGLPEPLIKPKGIDDVPIVSLTLHGKNADVSAFDLERVAHSIEADIKRVPGTRDVVTIGGPRRAVLVQIDPQRMNGSGVTVHDLRMALQSANLGLPVGDLLGGNQSVAIEAGPHLSQASEVADLVVQVVQGKPVFLKDVADVQDGPMPAARYVWHGNNEKNGGEEFAAVTLSITKKSGENAIDVANGVKSRGGGDPQLRRNRQRQSAKADPETAVCHRVGGGTGVHGAGPPRGRHCGRGRHLDPDRDIVRLMGLGLHAQPRVAVCADFFHRHFGGRCHRGGGKHPPPPAIVPRQNFA
jgi:multidrug efflux pump subunit AcrB